jgi:vacuolar-type H+-ATPase subunit F/Vma7
MREVTNLIGHAGQAKLQAAAQVQAKPTVEIIICTSKLHLREEEATKRYWNHRQKPLVLEHQ